MGCDGARRTSRNQPTHRRPCKTVSISTHEQVSRIAQLAHSSSFLVEIINEIINLLEIMSSTESVVEHDTETVLDTETVVEHDTVTETLLAPLSCVGVILVVIVILGYVFGCGYDSGCDCDPCIAWQCPVGQPRWQHPQKETHQAAWQFAHEPVRG